MSATKKITAGVAGVAAAIGIALGIASCGGHSTPVTKSAHHATCWTPSYATAHNTSGVSPAPRHGAGKLGDNELCYTGK